MRLTGAVAFACLLGFASNSYAGENEKPNKIEDLTTTQLGDTGDRSAGKQQCARSLGAAPFKTRCHQPLCRLEAVKAAAERLFESGKVIFLRPCL